MGRGPEAAITQRRGPEAHHASCWPPPEGPRCPAPSLPAATGIQSRSGIRNILGPPQQSNPTLTPLISNPPPSPPHTHTRARTHTHTVTHTHTCTHHTRSHTHTHTHGHTQTHTHTHTVTHTVTHTFSAAWSSASTSKESNCTQRLSSYTALQQRGGERREQRVHFS